ncbi:hypothetical protein NB037_17080 [Rathayibacter sp. ZW T2_19]|uniref:Regulator of chromosome condensation (RCC1) repeat-containing protein n=1 Tax=Rathayibacter rubneri TaxID=2950106 RepID=A0A9X2DZI8_9MICO|nr:hypothetical protein [Rathayibacter rubneri]MCM6764130.1 hypothetical protein [Rathayibacter rubneri]
MPATAASPSGSIAFGRSSYETHPDRIVTGISGSLSKSSGTFPAEVTLTYPAGFSGPATAAVDLSSGRFLLDAVRAPATPSSGLVHASAPGYGSASATLSALATPILPTAGPAVSWGYITMNGTGGSNRNYAAAPTKVVNAGYTSYLDIAQVGDEATYVITGDGRSLVSFLYAAVTERRITVALNNGETLAALAGGPQWIAVLTSEGRVFTSHYSVTNLTNAYQRVVPGLTFVKIAHFDSDGAGAVGLASNGTVWILRATAAPMQVTDSSNAPLSGIVDIAAGRNPKITALKSDGTVWSVGASSGTSSSTPSSSLAHQVWAGAEGNPLIASSLAVHSSPYSDSAYVTAAVGRDGLIWVWGSRVSFQVRGASDTARFARSVDVVTDLGLSGVSVKNVSVSAPIFVTLSNGRVASFGNPGDEGERGDGTSSNFIAAGGESFTPSYVVTQQGVPIEGIDRVATTRGGGWAIIA